MPEIEQLIHDWTEHATAEAPPVTVDEIRTRIHPPDAATTGPNVVTVRPRPLPLLKLAAAVVAIVAIVGGALALTDRDDSSPVVTDPEGGAPTPFEMTPVADRLLSLLPPEPDGFIIWNDLAAARETGGLAPPPAGADDDEVRAYMTELGRVRPGLNPWTPWPSQGAERLEWWRSAGIDPTAFDGWAMWGQLPGIKVVALGSFSPEDVDAAVRSNSGAADMVVAEHRGVTTYSWGADDAMETEGRERFPGFGSMRLAVADDVLILARSTAAVHEVIDRHLDDNPSLRERTDVIGILDALGGQAQLGANLQAFERDIAIGWDLRPVPPSGPERWVFAAIAVPPGSSVEAESARITAAIDGLVDEQLATEPDSWLADITIEVEPAGPDARAIPVVVRGAQLDDEARSEATVFLNSYLLPAIDPWSR